MGQKLFRWYNDTDVSSSAVVQYKRIRYAALLRISAKALDDFKNEHLRARESGVLIYSSSFYHDQRDVTGTEHQKAGQLTNTPLVYTLFYPSAILAEDHQCPNVGGN